MVINAVRMIELSSMEWAFRVKWDMADVDPLQAATCGQRLRSVCVEWNGVWTLLKVNPIKC